MGLLDRLSALLGEDDGGGDDGGGDADGGGDLDELLGAGTDDGSDGGDGDAAPPAEGGDPDEMAPADLRAAAEEFAADHGGDDRFDFTLASLAALDEYAAGQAEVTDALDEEVDDDGLDRLHGGYALLTGSYLGEVLVREFDGAWVDGDGWTVEVPVEGGAMEVAVFDIAAESMAAEPLFASVGEELREGPGSAAGDETAGDVTGGDGTASDGDAERAGAARELAGYWRDYDLDFTPASLARLDALVDDQWDERRFQDAERGGEDLPDDRAFTALVHQLGSYYGEVLVRALDAEWVDVEGSATAVEVDGPGEASAVANVYDVAAACLTGPPTFAASFDAVVDRLALDHERVSEDDQAVAAERDALGADGPAAGEPADGGPDEGGPADGGPDEGGPDEGGARVGDVGGVGEGADAGAGEGADAGAGEGAHGSGAGPPEGGADAPEPPTGAAEALAAEHADRELDFSPGSLARLDDLVAAHDGPGEALAGGLVAYLGETLVRSYGAEWAREGDRWVVDVGGEAMTLSLRAVVDDRLAGETTFAAVHDDLVAGLDLDGPRLADAAEAGGVERDPTLERFAARAAAEEAAEQQAAPDPAAAAERHRAAAEELVAGWPSYGLDYSVESLVRLDALVADAFDRADGDRDYEGDPLTVPEGAQLSIPTDGSVASFAGYLAELFRRHHGAEWVVADGDLALAVEGPAGAATFDPELVAVACFAGESSFVDAYAHVAAATGLDPPIDG